MFSTPHIPRKCKVVKRSTKDDPKTECGDKKEFGIVSVDRAISLKIECLIKIRRDGKDDCHNEEFDFQHPIHRD